MPRKKKKKKDDIPSPYSDRYAGMDTGQLSRTFELEQRDRQMKEQFGNAQIGRVGSGRHPRSSDGTLGSMGMQNPNLNAPVTSSKEWFQNVLGLGMEAGLLIGGLPGLAGRAGVATASRLPGVIRGAGARPLPKPTGGLESARARVVDRTLDLRYKNMNIPPEYIEDLKAYVARPDVVKIHKGRTYDAKGTNPIFMERYVAGDESLPGIAKKGTVDHTGRPLTDAGKSPKGPPQGHAARQMPKEPPPIPREPSAHDVMLDRDLRKKFPDMPEEAFGLVRAVRDSMKAKEFDTTKQYFTKAERDFRNRPGSEHHPDVRDRGTANSRKGRPDNRQVAEGNRAYMEKKAADELAGYKHDFRNIDNPSFPGFDRLERAQEAIRRHPASPGQTAVHGDAEAIAMTKIWRREANRIPDSPPMVRGPSNVPRRGIPGGEKLGRHITRIGDDATTRRGFEEGGLSSSGWTPPFVIVGGGLYEGFREKRDRKAKGLNDLRNQGIGIGRYASSAASSLPPYGGRR